MKTSKSLSFWKIGELRFVNEATTAKSLSNTAPMYRYSSSHNIFIRVRHDAGGRVPSGASAAPRISSKSEDHGTLCHSTFCRSPFSSNFVLGESRGATYTWRPITMPLEWLPPPAISSRGDRGAERPRTSRLTERVAGQGPVLYQGPHLCRAWPLAARPLRPVLRRTRLPFVTCSSRETSTVHTSLTSIDPVLPWGSRQLGHRMRAGRAARHPLLQG